MRVFTLFECLIDSVDSSNAHASCKSSQGMELSVGFMVILRLKCRFIFLKNFEHFKYRIWREYNYLFGNKTNIFPQ